MKATVQARLDVESRRTLAQLVERLGLSPSEVVREGVRLLAACRLGNGRRRILGQGQFDSGIKDLASNKKHLKGFGR